MGAPAHWRESTNDWELRLASARLNEDSRWRSRIDSTCWVSTKEKAASPTASIMDIRTTASTIALPRSARRSLLTGSVTDPQFAVAVRSP